MNNDEQLIQNRGSYRILGSTGREMGLSIELLQGISSIHKLEVFSDFGRHCRVE